MPKINIFARLRRESASNLVLWGLLSFASLAVVVQLYALRSSEEIVLQPSQIKLGKCAIGEKRSASILVENRSNHAVYLRKVQGTCGCIATSSAAVKIAPRESHVVEIDITMPLKSEVFSKDILFFIDEHDSLKTLTASISGIAYDPEKNASAL